MKHPLELLDQIQKVEAPPFLMTRIRQKIDAAAANQIPGSWVWSLGLSFILVMGLNIAIIVNNMQVPTTDDNIVNTMNLSPDNALYK